MKKLARLEKEYQALAELLAECYAYPSTYYFSDEREDIARKEERANLPYIEIQMLKAKESSKS